jgi:eukaryotic-like serine/threonine-protein kinase
VSASTSPADPMVGTTLARRYRVESLIGRGGMCAVYRARDEKENRAVALKVLPAELASDPELGRRFQRELTTGKRLKHPNVCALFDAGKLDDGAQFLVMELLDGPSLATTLHAGPLAWPRAVAVARQMLLGLDEAHKIGVAHRDVKPENAILVQPGGHETVKLLDFGIASNDRAAQKLTAAGVAFGTPEYISPEMATGLAVDGRADLYAVGVVLFQMTTGRLPFQGEAKDLLRAHSYDRPPRPRDLRPDLPPALEAVILRAMQKLPEERFPDAAAMVAALDAVRRPANGRAGVIAAVVALLGAAAAAAWWLTRG